MRVGMGYDVHKLVEGRDLILGGVKIPHTLGLLGHSDADVLLHAIMDALLGAAALGDIGKHFPDTDPQYKGISSIRLLEHVAKLIEEKGYIVVEATIRLTPKEKEQIFAEMEDIRKRRLEKQPLEFPSAGSTFKRPEGYFAGKLIQDSGLSGASVGGAQVSEKHNGFVINKGNATAQDVLTLIENVKKEVYRQFQVELVPEVKIVGE